MLGQNYRPSSAMPACAAISPATTSWPEMELAYQIDVYRHAVESYSTYGVSFADLSPITPLAEAEEQTVPA
jgi:hypothetical protein